MAKYYGSIVKTGKLGGSVFSVRNGVTIERQYQPNVMNPSTEAQVATRAKFKLISQLATVFSAVIAMTRNGMVSVRNQFAKYNYDNISYATSMADVDLSKIKLTKSVVPFERITAERSGGNVLVSVVTTPQWITRVVYVLAYKSGEEVRLVGSIVVSDAGENRTFPGTFSNPANSELYVYAYGIRENNENARAVFGNLTSPTGEDVARIIVSRTLTETDVSLTETMFVKVAAIQGREEVINEEKKPIVERKIEKKN